jgi:hypothetical protein
MQNQSADERKICRKCFLFNAKPMQEREMNEVIDEDVRRTTPAPSQPLLLDCGFSLFSLAVFPQHYLVTNSITSRVSSVNLGIYHF